MKEHSRSRGLRRALGDLVSCPVCTGPWVATALYALDGVAPQYARTIASLFASVAVSDFLHGLYGATLARARTGERRPADASSREKQQEGSALLS